MAFRRRREDCKAVHIRPALTVLQANLCFGRQLPSLFPNPYYFTPQRQTLNCTFIVYKHLRPALLDPPSLQEACESGLKSWWI